MITSKCNRNCSYCISKNVKREESNDYLKLAQIYRNMYKEGHKELMLTGGEPTLTEKLYPIIKLAKSIFQKVCIVTQNFDILPIFKEWSEDFHSVMFSLHDISIAGFPVKTVKGNTPLYASILGHQYSAALVLRLVANGWGGLAIAEEQRDGKRFDETQLGNYNNFTFKVNRKGHCVTHWQDIEIKSGEVIITEEKMDPIIFPDLEICRDFEEYL